MEWLANLLTVAGGGTFLWLIVGFIIKLFPALDQNSGVKFWMTIVLAFVIPSGAYGLEIALGYATFTWEGLFLVIGTGYGISQTVHRGTEQLQGKS
jgi:hypothetical protein